MIATHALQRECACGGTCGPCAAKERKGVRRSASHREAASRIPSSVQRALASPGRPLDAATRSVMEPRFGHDFSRVRVHDDAQAAASARDVHAHAYTVGSDIVFGAGRHAPDSEPGRRTLAHELTHVVQQSGGASSIATSSMAISDPSDASEREAEAVADRVVRGGAANVAGVSSNAVQRLGDLSKVPPGLGCPVVNSSSAAPVTNTFLFAHDSFLLNAAQKIDLVNFVSAWHADGGSKHVRIDGFASVEGTDEHNWTLSCNRAEAVLAELTSPSSRTTPGIPAGFIEFFAQGETNEFGTTLPPNRRAEIRSTLVLPPMSVVAPACPLGAGSTVMTATVQPVRIARNDGTHPTTLPSFARLDIWRRCCVDVRVASPITINNTAFQTVDDLDGAAGPTAEENSVIALIPAGTQINVIMVNNFSVGGVVSTTARGGAVTFNFATAQPSVFAVQSAVSEVIAHEVGHGLTGSAAHTCPDTVMCPTSSPTVPNSHHVNAGVCASARTGAVLTASTTSCCLNPT